MSNVPKKASIRGKLRQLITTIAFLSMTAISVSALVSMYTIRTRSEKYILEHIEENAMDSLDDVALYTEMKLHGYSNQVKESAYFLNKLYLEREKYIPRELDTHVHLTDHNYCFHRYLASKRYNEKDIMNESNLLSNIEALWIPTLEYDDDNITSIYFGTESGFFLSYDKTHIEDSTNEGNEAFFNYFERPWYQQAKEEEKMVFTDVSQDYFGRGLTLTCSTPFYNEKGELAGVVALDILVKDIQDNIIAIDAGEGSSVFAVDHNGDIVASTDVVIGASEFDNIRTIDDKEMNQIADDILSGTTGIRAINDNYYVYTFINNIRWSLCVKIPQSIINASVRGFDRSMQRMILNFVVLAVAILIIVFFISKSFATKITNPVLSLTRDAEIISNGNLDYKAEILSNDEISDLANTFNNMTASLKNYINDLTNLTAEKERTGAELSIAASIQTAMLPSEFPAFPDDKRFDIFATMHPAKEVGGDFYDFFKLDEKHIAIVVADVSGKGIPASLFMAIGKTLIKDHSFHQVDLSAVFYNVNNLLCESNKENLFITAFEGVINLDTGLMTYVNAGHELPFIYRKNGIWTPHVMKPCFVLAGMEYMQYSVDTIQLEHGDRIFEYTDGVTEATNSKSELYGMERLNKVLNENVDKSVMDLLPAIKNDIDDFVGDAPQFDDITMLAFEYK